jgi:predicted PurR-regulated permease PerM
VGSFGDTFLIVFVGIFLALVFEYPVRLVMAKLYLSRGMAATVTVLGSALSRCLAPQGEDRVQRT